METVKISYLYTVRIRRKFCIVIQYKRIIKKMLKAHYIFKALNEENNRSRYLFMYFVKKFPEIIERGKEIFLKRI